MSKSIICGLGGRTEIAQKVPILGECDNALALAMSAGEFDAHEQSNSADVEDLLAPRAGCLLRNRAAVGLEVGAAVRPRTSPSTPAANIEVASR
jgi:hypothetical protein